MSALIATLALNFLLRPDEEFVLKRTPKAGSAFVYSATLEFASPKIKAKVKAKSEQKVALVNTDGTYSVEDRTLEYKFDMDGKLSDGPNLSTTTLYDVAGRVMTLEGTQPVSEETYRYANLTLMLWPTKKVKIGEAWGADTAASPTSGGVAFSSKFTLTGRDVVQGVNCLRVMFSHTEADAKDSARSVGTFWIDPADGRTMKLEVQMNNVPIEGEPYQVKETVLADKPS